MDVTGKCMVFRNEHNGRVFYNAGLSKKTADGEWENGSIGIDFRKGTSIAHKTRIDIKKGFLTFYKKDKVTVPTIFALEFEAVETPPSAEYEEDFSDDGDLPF